MIIPDTRLMSRQGLQHLFVALAALGFFAAAGLLLAALALIGYLGQLVLSAWIELSTQFVIVYDGSPASVKLLVWIVAIYGVVSLFRRWSRR